MLHNEDDDDDDDDDACFVISHFFPLFEW